MPGALDHHARELAAKHGAMHRATTEATTAALATTDHEALAQAAQDDAAARVERLLTETRP
jgi:hypothetical protein